MDSFTLTSIDAAHRQLAMAVRLFFNDGDPVSVHTLACAAREIYEKSLRAHGRERVIDTIALDRTDWHESEILHTLNERRNFFKHPTKGDLKFSDEDNDCVLLVASLDCTELCGDGSPQEASAFLLWMTATSAQFPRGGSVLSEIEADRVLKDLDDRYPGLRDSSRVEKKRFGRELFSDGCPVVPPSPREW